MGGKKKAKQHISFRGNDVGRVLPASSENLFYDN